MSFLSFPRQSCLTRVRYNSEGPLHVRHGGKGHLPREIPANASDPDDTDRRGEFHWRCRLEGLRAGRYRVQPRARWDGL